MHSFDRATKLTRTRQFKAAIKRNNTQHTRYKNCGTSNDIHSSICYNNWNNNAVLFGLAMLLMQAHAIHARSTSYKLRTYAKPTGPELTAVSGGLASSTTSTEKFSIEINALQRINKLNEGAAAANELDHNRSLKRVFLSNRTITCNDGSQAGFYFRKNLNSKKWIVFLEGGWHCFDTRSCRSRWLKMRHLMTSAQWPETRDVGGILSPLADENPYWHNANHVLVPYCSSDSWSGTRMQAVASETRDNNWRFMGALILRQVIADLIPLGLGRAAGAELLLVGSSAGGLGVMLNLDGITKFLVQERNLLVMVRGVSDSGWFLDREPYTPSAVASSEAVRQGWKLWQGLLPEDCTRQHAAEPWRCYFGYHLYPTLKSPRFVFQWLFDEAQMRADNVGAPVTPEQWNYIHEMGAALRSSLDNVTAVFAPSCIGHAVISKRDWVHIKIDDISLPAALRCWEHSTKPRRKRQDKLSLSTEANSSVAYMSVTKVMRKQRHKNKHNNTNSRHPKRHNDNKEQPKAATEPKRRRNEVQQRRREQRRHLHKKHVPDNNRNVTNYKGARRRKQRRQKNKQHNNNNNNNNNNMRGKNRKAARLALEGSTATAAGNSHISPTVYSFHSISHGNNKSHGARLPRVPEKCALRLMERCSWPQCNHSCPTLTNPLTGEEMRFLELLTSFGLDIEAVATALGVDMHTLNNMDHTELVNLLTQQVS